MAAATQADMVLQLLRAIHQHRTTNVRELDAVERQQLTDLLAEVEIGINGTDAVGF